VIKLDENSFWNSKVRPQNIPRIYRIHIGYFILDKKALLTSIMFKELCRGFIIDICQVLMKLFHDRLPDVLVEKDMGKDMGRTWGRFIRPKKHSESR